jgi:hypothetical protein
MTSTLVPLQPSALSAKYGWVVPRQEGRAGWESKRQVSATCACRMLNELQAVPRSERYGLVYIELNQVKQFCQCASWRTRHDSNV